MYKWFTLQFPSVETLYGLCQENMNIEHKRGRGWNNIRLSPGWHGDRAHSRNGAHWIAWAAYHCHGPIPMSSLEVGQGWYWRASSVTTVGIKRNRIMGFPSGEMLQPIEGHVVFRFFYYCSVAVAALSAAAAHLSELTFLHHVPPWTTLYTFTRASWPEPLQASWTLHTFSLLLGYSPFIFWDSAQATYAFQCAPYPLSKLHSGSSFLHESLLRAVCTS